MVSHNKYTTFFASLEVKVTQQVQTLEKSFGYTQSRTSIRPTKTLELSETNNTRQTYLSHDGAAALFFCWLWGNLLKPVRLRWVVCELGSIQPILFQTEEKQEQRQNGNLAQYESIMTSKLLQGALNQEVKV